MATSLPLPAHSAPVAAGIARSRVASIPWYIWCAVFAATSAMVGAHWDISWHRSIGRDTFWTPAHIAIYLCGVLAGISCGYLILSRSFGFSDDLATVKVWGFRAPLGAFLASWGGIAMLTSAPFDNWWHDAYGLDVKIVSPPHVLLISGSAMVMMGALLLTLGHMNRATGAAYRRLNAMFLYLGAMCIVLMGILLLEFNVKVLQHTAGFYQRLSLAIPFLLAGVARASGIRWATTIVAGIYTLFIYGAIWILPLFPAEPKLGPVYIPVTHFIPPDCPPLFLVPAFLLDLLWQRTESWNKWKLAVVSGVLFTGVLLAVQWPFASFLLSEHSKNAIFGTHYMGYYQHPQSFTFRRVFVPAEPDFLPILGSAFLFAILSMRAGFTWGEWMRTIKR